MPPTQARCWRERTNVRRRRRATESTLAPSITQVQLQKPSVGKPVITKINQSITPGKQLMRRREKCNLGAVNCLPTAVLDFAPSQALASRQPVPPLNQSINQSIDLRQASAFIPEPTNLRSCGKSSFWVQPVAVLFCHLQQSVTAPVSLLWRRSQRL